MSVFFIGLFEACRQKEIEPMNPTLKLVLTIIQVIDCVFMIISILFQSSKNEGLSGAIVGTAETFFGKNRARSLDAKLAKLTAGGAAVFIILSFVLAIFN
jgi:preprotein translocase subunit SecG